MLIKRDLMYCPAHDMNLAELVFLLYTAITAG
jgi:hypothetical protein